MAGLIEGKISINSEHNVTKPFGSAKQPNIPVVLSQVRMIDVNDEKICRETKVMNNTELRCAGFVAKLPPQSDVMEFVISTGCLMKSAKPPSSIWEILKQKWWQMTETLPDPPINIPENCVMLSEKTIRYDDTVAALGQLQLHGNEIYVTPWTQASDKVVLFAGWHNNKIHQLYHGLNVDLLKAIQSNLGRFVFAAISSLLLFWYLKAQYRRYKSTLRPQAKENNVS